ncbi:hypothetical protein Bca4012_063892 [Brassica carinata]|uniref:Exocyst complex subunit Exo70 C-terminal domain-containing protein n=1 Tax=Brassica carinata TaxID=52824 RepID=A0A8X7V687_BRACI|nr:hypothetical protein Bca52824_033616 [Brassica carinata]
MMGESWLNAQEQYRDYYAGLYVKEIWGKLLSLLSNKAQTIKRTLQAFAKGDSWTIGVWMVGLRAGELTAGGVEGGESSMNELKRYWALSGKGGRKAF